MDNIFDKLHRVLPDSLFSYPSLFKVPKLILDFTKVYIIRKLNAKAICTGVWIALVSGVQKGFTIKTDSIIVIYYLLMRSYCMMFI